jgi:leucyl aminopeptidase
MFSLNIKSANKKIVYKQLSISVKYLIDEKKLSESFKDLEKIFNIKISVLQKKNFLSENGNQIRISKSSGKPDALILNKVKIKEHFSSDFFRNHLAGLIKSLEDEELNNLHIFIPSYKPFKDYFDGEEYYYQTFIEGLLLGNYKFDKYKSSKKISGKLNILIHADNEKLLRSAISKATLLLRGVNFAKDLQNEPGSSLKPSDLASRVKKKLTKEKWGDY